MLAPPWCSPFRDAGYHTAWIGKWHLDGSNSGAHIIPPERRGGFAYWRGYENNNAHEESYVYGGYADATHPGYDPADETPARLPGYETDSLTDVFTDHLRRLATHSRGRLTRRALPPLAADHPGAGDTAAERPARGPDPRGRAP